MKNNSGVEKEKTIQNPAPWFSLGWEWEGGAGGGRGGGEAEGYGRKIRGEVIYIRPRYIGAKTVSLSPSCSLMRSPGSLLVSSHVSITDADTSSTRLLCPAPSSAPTRHRRRLVREHSLGLLSLKSKSLSSQQVRWRDAGWLSVGGAAEAVSGRSYCGVRNPIIAERHSIYISTFYVVYSHPFSSYLIQYWICHLHFFYLF